MQEFWWYTIIGNGPGNEIANNSRSLGGIKLEVVNLQLSEIKNIKIHIYFRILKFVMVFKKTPINADLKKLYNPEVTKYLSVPKDLYR